MKKLYLLKLVFCSLCCGVVLSACTEDNEDTALAKLSITPTDTTLYVGDSFQYKTQVVPQELQESVGWKCSDESVLSITPNGVVTALKEGDVTVSAFGKAFKNLALAKVHVKQGIPVKNVLLPEEGFKVFLGEPLKLQLKVEPENANVLDFQYAIEQPNLASVSTEGVIQPKAVGNTTLLVKIREKTYSCPLQIRDHIKIRNTNFHLVVGAQFLLDYDNNYAKGDQPHAVLDITVANKDVLLGISETKPLVYGSSRGKNLIDLVCSVC